MSIKKLVNAIKALEVAEGKEEEISKVINLAEDLYHNQNTEARDHRLSGEKFRKKVAEALSLDGDVESDDIINALSGEKQQGSKLERQMAKLEKELGKLTTERDELANRAKQSDLKSKITETLGKSGVRKEAQGMLTELFMGKAKQDEAGDWVIGDVDLGDALKSHLDENKFLLSAQQKPGAGAQKPQGEANGQTFYSQADVQAMSPAERKANLTAIKTSREKAASEGKNW